MEAALDLAPLIQYCKHYDERFPLLVAKAACMHLTQSSFVTEHSPSPNRSEGASKAGCPQGDVWQVQLWQSWSKNYGQNYSSKHALRQTADCPFCLSQVRSTCLI